MRFGQVAAGGVGLSSFPGGCARALGFSNVGMVLFEEFASALLQMTGTREDRFSRKYGGA